MFTKPTLSVRPSILAILITTILCLLTLQQAKPTAAGSVRSFDDCRRLRKPLKPGEVALDGIWLDHSNNRKVRIAQNGSNLNRTAQVVARYVDPNAPMHFKAVRCENPPMPGIEYHLPNGYFEMPEDFSGDLINLKFERGAVSLCMWEDVPNKGRYTTGVVSGPIIDLAVSEDGKSMHGHFKDPVKGITAIDLTLETSFQDKYYPLNVITTDRPTNLYEDSNSSSKVKQVLPPGTTMMEEQAILGPDGTPTWYYVTELYHYRFNGFVPADMIKCPEINKPSS